MIDPNEFPKHFPVRASTHRDKRHTFYVADLPRKMRRSADAEAE